MTGNPTIIDFGDWLPSPAGRYLLAWEQTQCDAAVADLFGYHALQLGMPQLDALRANRVQHRWVAIDAPVGGVAATGGTASMVDGPLPFGAATPVLCCDYHALPFPEKSLDLVVLPHSLELARDAHQTLSEVERVLRPEGRVVIVGFNPASLWGLRQRYARTAGRVRDGRPGFIPPEADLIGYWRLRDWLRLLSFDIERGRFGCYRPPFDTQRWLNRCDWMEPAGDRWWPVFGAVYFLVAVKRVRGMRLVGLARRERPAKAAAPAVVTQRHHRQDSNPSS